MNTRLLSLAAVLSLLAGSAAFAQDNPTGRWLYDAQGNKIGSVRAITPGGRTAEIMLGSYFRPGSHATNVPVSALSIVDGKVTLRPETVQALNTVPRE